MYSPTSGAPDVMDPLATIDVSVVPPPEEAKNATEFVLVAVAGCVQLFKAHTVSVVVLPKNVPVESVMRPDEEMRNFVELFTSNATKSPPNDPVVLIAM